MSSTKVEEKTEEVSSFITFQITISGLGVNIQSAWEDAVENFNHDHTMTGGDEVKEIEFECPECYQRNEIKEDNWHNSTQVTCTQCGWSVTIIPYLDEVKGDNDG